MNIERWNRMEQILSAYGVKPLVGIIPLNRDPMLLKFAESPAFWDKAKIWQENGWRIALHGYEHVYSTDCAVIIYQKTRTICALYG